MPANTEDQVARLIAVQEIRELAYRYAMAFDARDFDAFRSLWSDSHEERQMPVLSARFGRSTAFEEAAAELGPTFLFVGNHVIDFDGGDRARGRVYCLCQQEVGEEFIDQSILYRDHYVRQRGTWLFESREHLLFFGQRRDRNPYEQPPANWPESPYGSGTLPFDFPGYRRTRAHD